MGIGGDGDAPPRACPAPAPRLPQAGRGGEGDGVRPLGGLAAADEKNAEHRVVHKHHQNQVHLSGRRRQGRRGGENPPPIATAAPLGMCAGQGSAPTPSAAAAPLNESRAAFPPVSPLTIMKKLSAKHSWAEGGRGEGAHAGGGEVSRALPRRAREASPGASLPGPRPNPPAPREMRARSPVRGSWRRSLWTCPSALRTRRPR